MFKYILFVFCISPFHCQVQAQCPARQLSFFRQLQPEVIETPGNFVPQPTILTESQAQYQCPSRQLNFFRQFQPEVIETPGTFVPQPTIFTETPCTNQIPLLQQPSSTTIITDCSPTACKNLANTLQLMIVCNLLQNTRGGPELALQLAAPIINELFTSPVLSCGCSNPFATNVISPNLITPSAVSPNLISGLTNVVSSSAPFLTYAAGGLLSGAL